MALLRDPLALPVTLFDKSSVIPKDLVTGPGMFAMGCFIVV
jgi:hypothetical protein